MKRFALFLALVTSLVVGPLQPTATAATTQSNGRIVFSRFDPAADDSFTYILGSDGTARPLFPAFTSGSPNWSPDGRHVAVISGLGQSCSPTTCTGNTVIIDPTDGSWRALPPVGMPRVGTFCSLWSPNGQWFACEGGNDTNTSVNGIYLIRSSDGGGLRRITDARGMADVPIAWSPDGSQLAFGRWDFGGCSKRSAIYVVNLDGTDEHRITPWGFCDNHGDWSNDGRWIVFAKPGPNSIFVVHPDGSGLAKVSLDMPGRVFPGDVSWSPDGRKLVMLLFVSTENGAGDYHDYQEGIATANADGSHARFRTVSPTFDHEADWGARPS
jgi:Tol biopolymer transport system component